VFGGVILGAVRREPEVDGHRRLVGDDVAGDSPADADGVEPFAILETVDVHAPRLVLVESRQDLRSGMDGVLAHPCTSRMCADALCHDLSPQGALAAGFDPTAGRLHQDREVGHQEIGPFACDAAETVVDVLDLLAFVEHKGDVSLGSVRSGGEPQGDG
jgi:hypothetical protein